MVKKTRLDQPNREWWDSYTSFHTRGEDEMKLNEVYKSGGNFLKAEDLQGKTIRLTIAEISTHTFDEGTPKEKTQLVLSFVGKEKRLGLNVTNANSIAKILGDDTDSWPNGEIKVFPTTTDFGDRKDVPCIRIVEEMPPEVDDETIPF